MTEVQTFLTPYGKFFFSSTLKRFAINSFLNYSSFHSEIGRAASVNLKEIQRLNYKIMNDLNESFIGNYFKIAII